MVAIRSRKKPKKRPGKKKVDIEADKVDITSAETTDKVIDDKAHAAEIAASAVKAAAAVAARVKLEADRAAADVKASEALIAKEVRATEAEAVANTKRLEFWKLIALPVMLALISGAVVAVPTSITAWGQSSELRQIKKTGDETHILVNRNMSAQLKISANALRALARLTMDADDIAAAELAEKMMQEHEIKIRKMDQDIRKKNSAAIEENRSSMVLDFWGGITSYMGAE